MSEEAESTYTRRRRTRKSNGEESHQSGGASDTKPVSSPEKHHESQRTNTGFQRLFVDVLGWGIFVLWSVGFAIDMLNIIPNWDLPPGIWGLMTIVCGAAFVSQALKRPSGED